MKILIVDDIEDNLYLLESLLKGSGYEVVNAKDGVEALSKLKKETIDMIVSDILMPRMDGFQLCKECKGDDSLKKIPFIFYTATYTEEKDEEFALSLGAEKFIVKPQEPEVFLKILEEVIEEYKKGALVAPKEPVKEEKKYLVEYNERLIQKLEKKMLDLEKSEKRLKYLYGVLGAIRGVNQLIVREKDRNILIQKTCDVLMGALAYNAVWLGLLKDEKSFATIVGSPLEADVSLFFAQVLRGDHPPCIKKALTKLDPFLLIDRSRDCGDCSFKKLHLGKNSLLIRIAHESKLFGFLALSLEPDVYMDQEEKGLLEEVAGDIAFCLHNMELEEQHKQAEEELLKNQYYLTKAQEMGLIGTWELDIQKNILIWTDENYKIFGVPPGTEMNYELFLNCIHPDDRDYVNEKWSAGLNHEPYDIEHRLIVNDKVKWVREKADIEFDKEGNPVMAIGFTQDITKRKQAEERLKKTMNATIDTMSNMIEAKDPYTSGHQHRVCQLAVPLARELGLSEDKVEGIRIASLIHDIGKIGIPTEILSKPTRLTDMEFILIKDHSQIGYDILKSIDFPWPVARIVLQHHERLNGTGYPNKLKGDEIILEAKIIGVADVVEAMSSHRPYRPALGIDKALGEISKNKGTLYEPEVVDACIKLFKEKRFKF